MRATSLSVNPPLADAASPSRPVVVVVDDEAMVGEIFCAILQMEGYKTHLFTCPIEAEDYITSSLIKPDILIADYGMAPINGLELIDHCRDHLPDLRAILCSGSFEDVLSDSAIQPNAFLTKPFLPRELIQTTQTVLEGSPVLSN